MDNEELAEKVQTEFDRQRYGAGMVGGGGKKPAGSGSKTVKQLRRQRVDAANLHTRQELEARLARDLQHFWARWRSRIDEQAGLVTEYLSWLNRSLKAGQPAWDIEKEVDCDQFGGRGPGGQNINKVQSAVRCTHRPSLIKANNQDNRDMGMNKLAALETLKGRLEVHLGHWRLYLQRFHGSVEVSEDLLSGVS